MVIAVTKEEFETSYAVNNGLFVHQFPYLGLEAVPCTCGMADCQGWQMISVAESRQAQRVIFLDDNLRGYEERIKC